MDQAEWEKILDYVDCHIHEKIDLCSLAEIAGYSPFTSAVSLRKR